MQTGTGPRLTGDEDKPVKISSGSFGG